MKFLIAEDNPDLREIFGLMVQGLYPSSEIFLAKDGEEAIEILKTHSDWRAVLSDYNMPKKNGGEVYKALRQQSKKIPFLLVSSEDPGTKPEFKDRILVGHLEKPFAEEDIRNAIDSMPVDTGLQEKGIPSNNGYVPIGLDVLLRIGHMDAPLFLKLSDMNFVKVLHAGAKFDKDEHERFTAKGVKNLYIEFFNYSSFILQYKKEILSREVWGQLPDDQAAEALAVDNEVIVKAGKTFGWSESTVQMAQQNIKHTIKFLERNPDLKKLVKSLKSKEKSLMITHNVLLAIACTAALDELGWESNMSREKIAFAALLHDMELDEDLFATKLTVLFESSIDEFQNSPEMKVVLEHPLKTAETIAAWPLCPPDVDTIIRQHHERPDGKGFPLGLDASRISPLSALFIVAEDMIYHSFENFGLDPRAYLESRREFYSRGEFKKVYEAMVKSVGLQAA